MAKVAFLIDNNYEDSEMTNPYEQIGAAGHETVIIAADKGATYSGKKGGSYVSDLSIQEANPAEFDAVVIPGGSAPEKVRQIEAMVKFVQELNVKGKPVAGICHGPQVMISAKILNGKTVTCAGGIKDDVVNAGAQYINEEVVVDGNLITSRSPKDEPAFIREILKQL